MCMHIKVNSSYITCKLLMKIETDAPLILITQNNYYSITIINNY